MKKTAIHFILYVADQDLSSKFYEAVFQLKPRLYVPGMTEFELESGVILGLMPEVGIKKLLGDKIKNPAEARGIPRAELYLLVENPNEFHLRAQGAGAREISPLEKRSWGHEAAYSEDLDGHILAFAGQ